MFLIHKHSIIKGKSTEIAFLIILNDENNEYVDHLSTKSSPVGVKTDAHDEFKNEWQTRGAENILLSNRWFGEVKIGPKMTKFCP